MLRQSSCRMRGGASAITLLNMTKQEKQYRQWIVSAISKARKSPSGKVPYMSVSPRMSEALAFTYMQWAKADGWLFSDGQYVYETRRTQACPISEILHNLNKGKYCNN